MIWKMQNITLFVLNLTFLVLTVYCSYVHCISEVNNTVNGTVDSHNCTKDGDCASPVSFQYKIFENKEMLKRTFFVLLGTTGLVVIYFIVRAVRLRSQSSKTRRYGLLTRPNKLEMQPLDVDDDDEDEDVTVYEVYGSSRNR